MKTIATLFVLLWASVCWGQCVPDTYHNCGNSPLTSFHAFRDSFPLPDTIVGQWSSQNDPVPPFWIGTLKGNTRLFTIDSLEIVDTWPDNGQFLIFPYCSIPWSPLQPIAYCQAPIYWMPLHTGTVTATLWIRAHFEDDGSDASHSVVLVGRGIAAPRKPVRTR